MGQEETGPIPWVLQMRFENQNSATHQDPNKCMEPCFPGNISLTKASYFDDDNYGDNYDNNHKDNFKDIYKLNQKENNW